MLGRTIIIMEAYEEMFKEISNKICGEEDIDSVMSEYDNLSSLETSSETNASVLKTEASEWISSDESIPWTQSKIASYNAAQKLFRCNECECVGFLSRVAEHWLGTHANLRVFQCPQCPYASAWARCVRMHLARQHNITPEQNVDSMATFWKENPVLEEVTNFLQRLKNKVENESAPALVEPEIKEEEPSPRMITATFVTTTPVAEVAVLEIPPETTMEQAEAAKRYVCSSCSYTTDRRDLHTRHQNIHRDEKPFHCYVCLKQFNRADHVKKHFVRMHREVPYDINQIRRIEAKEPVPEPTLVITAIKTEPEIEVKANICLPGFRQSSIRAEKPHKQQKPGDKRYSCCYCSWTGVDNWCLKRHLNTHIKPFVCGLCEYKAARNERLATHLYKVHNKRSCSRCSFLADDQLELNTHIQQQHK